MFFIPWLAGVRDRIAVSYIRTFRARPRRGRWTLGTTCEGLESRYLLSIFGLASTIPVGSSPQGSAVADLNGDGKPDLAVANQGSNTVSILLGNGNGTFQASVTYAAGNGPSAIVAGDFNNDGKPDLAVTDQAASIVSVLLNNGNGTFQTPVTFAVGSSPVELAVADLNHDGRLDLVTANSASGNISVLLGAASGLFQAATTVSAGGANPGAVAIADINRDGKLDVVTANLSTDNSLSFFAGNGDGTFQAAVVATATPSGAGARSIALGDFNGDAKLDVAIGATGSGSSNFVSISLGAGDGTFGAQQSFGVAGPPLSLAVADFNTDGKLDVVTPTSFLAGNGDGTFQTSSDFTAGTTPTGISAGDFNVDGKIDLAIANAGSANLTILTQQTPTSTGLTASTTTPVFGQSVLFTATVTPSAGTGFPTGVVTFKDGATTLGAAVLTNGVATFTTTALATTSHSITAVYGADPTFAASTSAPLAVTVSLASTLTTVTAPQVVYGQTATITATVAAVSPGAGVPSGTVAFKDGMTTLGIASLANGSATLSGSAFSVGAHSITVEYLGDPNFNASTSAPVTLTVGKASTATGFGIFPSATTVGQQITLTAVVGALAPGSGSPTGTVNFFDGANQIGSGTLTGGVATFATSSLTFGSHPLHATYLGDANFVGSETSASNASISNIVVTGSTVDVYSGGNNVFTFTAGTNFVITVNGTPFTYSPSSVSIFNFHGIAGGDSITLTGSSGTDTLGLQPLTADLSGSNYTVHVTNISTITANGGGGTNSAALYASNGIDDTFISGQNFGQLVGATFNNTVLGFTNVSGVNLYPTAGGKHAAFLYSGAASNVFVGTPAYSQLYGPGVGGNSFNSVASGYPVVSAINSDATPGITHTAYLYTSTGNDTFTGSPTSAQLQNGAGNASTFYITVHGFPSVNAFNSDHSPGVRHGALFQGSSGTDTFIGMPAFGQLYGTGYNNVANGFTTVSAVSSPGGADVAYLYGAGGGDTFVATTTYAQMANTGFNNIAYGFATAVGITTAGQNNIAYLYDSPGNDNFFGRSNYGVLAGNGFQNTALNFNRIFASSTSGGHDTIDIAALNYIFTKLGNWS